VGDVPSGRINLFVRPRLERMVGSFGIHAYERFGNSEVQMSKSNAVKLEWKSAVSGGYFALDALTSFGAYRIVKRKSGCHAFWEDFTVRNDIGRGMTFDDAKSACQRHFDERNKR
jgi:hypothetical protein